MLLRTWDDFYTNAARLFGKDEAKKLPLFMQQHQITKHQVLCFINWAVGMTRQEIANELCIDDSAVSHCIAHIQHKWPHIMSHIGPEKIEQYNKHKHDEKVTTGRGHKF